MSPAKALSDLLRLFQKKKITENVFNVELTKGNNSKSIDIRDMNLVHDYCMIIALIKIY